MKDNRKGSRSTAELSVGLEHILLALCIFVHIQTGRVVDIAPTPHIQKQTRPKTDVVSEPTCKQC